MAVLYYFMVNRVLVCRDIRTVALLILDYVTKGTFLAFLDYSVRSGNAALARKLSRMLSAPAKTNQNELIGCISDHIRDSIIGGASAASAATVRSSKSKFAIYSTYVRAICNQSLRR